MLKEFDLMSDRYKAWHQNHPIFFAKLTAKIYTLSIIDDVTFSYIILSLHLNSLQPKLFPSVLHLNSSSSYYYSYWTLNIDDFFATVKQKDQLPVIFTAINNDTIFINHMNDSISKLKETISNLQIEVNQQKSVAQSKLDDFLTQKLMKRIFWIAQNVLVEHRFHVPNVTPSASSKSSLDTMPVPSSDPLVYEMADKQIISLVGE